MSKFTAFLGPLDIQRLEAYSRNLVDYRLITDLLPVMAQLYFLGKFDSNFRLSPLQTAILVGVGMQSHTMDEIATQLDLPTGQLLAMFNKIVRKISTYLKRLEEKGKRRIEKHERWWDERKKRSNQKGKKKSVAPGSSEKHKLISDPEKKALPEEFMEYAIKGNETDWEAALSKHSEADVVNKGSVSIRKRVTDDSELPKSKKQKKSKKKKSKKHKKSSS